MLKPRYLAFVLSLSFLAGCQTGVTLDPPPSANQISIAPDLYKSQTDKNISIEELTRQADSGNPGAQNDLGACYGTGYKVKKDLDKSFHYYQLAADQNMPAAQANLGFMYYAGESVPRDFGKAAQWMYKAAIQGHFNGQYALGRMYAVGEGVPKNEETAEKWWLLSAGQGHLDSQIALKYLYEHGSRKDLRKAALWGQRIAFAQTTGHTWKATDTTSSEAAPKN